MDTATETEKKVGHVLKQRVNEPCFTTARLSHARSEYREKKTVHVCILSFRAVFRDLCLTAPVTQSDRAGAHRPALRTPRAQTIHRPLIISPANDDGKFIMGLFVKT